MESRDSQERDSEQGQTTGDESADEFAEQVEQDPSTANTGEDELEQVRGG